MKNAPAMHTYQALVHQALAVTVDSSVDQPIKLYVDRETPNFVVRPVHEKQTDRWFSGGTLIGVEFESEEGDLVQAMREGVALVEDLLAAVCLATGIPFRSNSPLQIIKGGPAPPFAFLRFLPFGGLFWPEPIEERAFADASRLQLHWRDTESGRRLKRAAERYRRSLASSDLVESFQHAFAGLESLEPPLAAEIGITPGSEVATGTCPACGVAYEYKKTALSAVPAFVKGEMHDEPSDQRANEWKSLNRLRTDVVHGLKDWESLEPRSRGLLATACHYLHDASVHLAHLHELESDEFRLMRFGKQIVFRGFVTLENLPDLSEQLLLLEAEPSGWAFDEGSNPVPEFQTTNRSGGSLEAAMFTLEGVLWGSSEEDLMPATFLAGEGL